MFMSILKKKRGKTGEKTGTNLRNADNNTFNISHLPFEAGVGLSSSSMKKKNIGYQRVNQREQSGSHGSMLACHDNSDLS